MSDLIEKFCQVRIKEEVYVYKLGEYGGNYLILDMLIISHLEDTGIDSGSCVSNREKYKGYALSIVDEEYYVIRYQYETILGFKLREISKSDWVWSGSPFSDEFVEICKSFLKISIEHRRFLNISKILCLIQ